MNGTREFPETMHKVPHIRMSVPSANESGVLVNSGFVVNLRDLNRHQWPPGILWRCCTVLKNSRQTTRTDLSANK